jgi:hypothetical protein
MDAQALAATPLFTISLVLCALLTVCGFTFFLKRTLSKAAIASATKGLMPDELQAIQTFGIFHNQVDALFERLSTVEELSGEMPAPFKDPSWNRLLELCDELQAAQDELNQLLQARRFSDASNLGSFLSGRAIVTPEFSEAASSLDLRKLRNWHETAHNLLQRFITLIQDAVDSDPAHKNTPLSESFLDTVQQIKRQLIAEEK